MYKFALHRVLILIASISWAISFFAEVGNYQPYSTIGIYIAVALMLAGVTAFLKCLYLRRVTLRREELERPRDFSVAPPRVERNPDIVINIILGFWTFCICIWMAGVLLAGLGFRNSEAFAATKAYCAANPRIREQTGGIRSYGLLIGGEISSGTDSGIAHLSFTIIGKAGYVQAQAEVVKSKGIWVVEKVDTR